MTIPFRYHPDILAKYPKLVGGIIAVSGVKNGPSSEALQQAYNAEQQAVIAKIGSKPLSEIESLSAWRGVFRSFGVDPTQIRSAAEALLRRLTKQGNIPSINTLVDLGNLVSIRYALPIAIVDKQALKGTITVHFADGSEAYTPLGQQTVEHPDPGEVVFTDENKLVCARRWCWRQSDESAARDSTTDIVITVEAHHSKGREDVESAMNDLLALLKEYAGGEATASVITVSNPNSS